MRRQATCQERTIIDGVDADLTLVFGVDVGQRLVESQVKDRAPVNAGVLRIAPTGGSFDF